MALTESLKSRVGESLFGKTAKEAMARQGVYGAAILLGLLTGHPEIIVAGLAGLTMSIKALGMAEAKKVNTRNASLSSPRNTWAA